MSMRCWPPLNLLLVILALSTPRCGAEEAQILQLPGQAAEIDYSSLPKLSGQLAVVNPLALGPHAEGQPKLDLHHFRLNLHNYLAWHDGRLWCIWSDGPRVEDEPTQEVRYATSTDGLTWTPARSVTGTPAAPYAFIARGLWVRDGELLALAAHYKGKGAFGADKELKLKAYAWDAAADGWKFKSVVYDNAINNFPPQRLPDGNWAMSRRDARFNVSMLIGGRNALDAWENFPVVGTSQVQKFRPDEPLFWVLPDQSLYALFRDNGGSQRLFHSASRDGGRSWTTPVKTNFPNATSKLYSLQTSRGYRVLILNARPEMGRRELYVALSRDGRTFQRLALLDIPSPPPSPAVPTAALQKKFSQGLASLQYPHAIEHEDHLLIAFSRNKLQTEVFRVPLAALQELLE